MLRHGTGMRSSYESNEINEIKQDNLRVSPGGLGEDPNIIYRNSLHINVKRKEVAEDIFC